MLYWSLSKQLEKDRKQGNKWLVAVSKDTQATVMNLAVRRQIMVLKFCAKFREKSHKLFTGCYRIGQTDGHSLDIGRFFTVQNATENLNFTLEVCVTVTS